MNALKSPSVVFVEYLFVLFSSKWHALTILIKIKKKQSKA